MRHTAREQCVKKLPILFEDINPVNICNKMPLDSCIKKYRQLLVIVFASVSLCTGIVLIAFWPKIFDYIFFKVSRGFYVLMIK